MGLPELILPRECHVCGERLLAGERYICCGCCAKLPRTLYHRFWQNRTATNSDLNPMEARFAGLVPFVHATAPFFYGRETKLATLVQDFKYRKFPGLARELGRMAALELLPTGFFTGIDVIVPVPLHWRKRMSRGYTQCEQIAYGVGEKTGLPVATNLRAARRHSTQTHLSREERQRNIKGVFKVRKAEALAGKHILLVDDICTTGSTLTAAAQALLAVCPGARLSMMTIGVV